jgi:zinc protease
VGDVDPDHAVALAEELLGEAAARGEHVPPQVPAEPAVEAARTAVKRMDKQQAHLVLGFLGTRVTDAGRFPLDVLASVLAGQGGRLFTELRDKRSMAYSITAFNLEGVDPGYFAVYMGTSPEKVDAAVEGIREELRKVRDEPVSEAEISRARRYLVGSHAIGLQKNAARAAVIAFDEAYGVGADAFTRYAASIEAVDARAVQEAARRTIDLDRAVLAVVTPAP